MTALGANNIMKQDKLDTPLCTPNPHLLNMRDPLPQISSSESGGFIYGTTIYINKVTSAIQRFLLQYQQTKMEDGQVVSEKVYRVKFMELDQDQSISHFDIQGKHIRQYDKQLYLQLIYYPAEMIVLLDSVVRDIYDTHFVQPETDIKTKYSKQNRKENILTGIKGLYDDQKSCVKELGPKHIGRLVLIRAIVLRVSQIYPQMKRAHFQCCICSNTVDVDMINARVQEPESCQVCRNKGSMQIMHNHCSFTDKQYIKLQELPQLIAEGETPSSLTAIAYDYNVQKYRPGDRIELIGIYRAQATKVDRYKGSLRSLFNTYLDVISCSILDQNKYGLEKISVFTDHQQRRFNRFSQSQEVIDNLVKSFAPSIYGHQIIKKGILTQLFGGTKKKLAGRGSTRADINICIVGDPSTAKSQLLQQVHRIAPRSIYTSGRGSSAVGLTANVRKDAETRQFVLQSGALVLADQGICCIDQFDKMDENSRIILLEAMQQQTISIAKAGIVCQLNARTAILAAANPQASKYNLKKSIMQNINLPASLISRFDLLYILLDISNEEADTKIATHILDFYIHGRKHNPNDGPLSLHQLTRYISYARQYVTPTLSTEAGIKLCKEYNSMRARGLSHKTITATTRQLQSLIRMSQAFAKMRLSNQVSQMDVQQAVTLMEKATLSSATDPSSGLIDLDIITTGRSAALKKKIQEIADHLRQFLFANETKYRKHQVLDKFMVEFNSLEMNKRLQATKQEMLEALRKLESDELIAIFGQNRNNPQFKLMGSNQE